MPSDPRVNKFRSSKNPEKQILLFDDGLNVKLHIVELNKGQIRTVENIPRIITVPEELEQAALEEEIQQQPLEVEVPESQTS